MVSIFPSNVNQFKWRKKFAWLPIRLPNGEKLWLEFYERRLRSSGIKADYWWQNRELHWQNGGVGGLS